MPPNSTDKPKRPSPIKRSDTEKRRIIETYDRLVSEGITRTEIAKKLGMTVPAMYSLLANRDRLGIRNPKKSKKKAQKASQGRTAGVLTIPNGGAPQFSDQSFEFGDESADSAYQLTPPDQTAQPAPGSIHSRYETLSQAPLGSPVDPRPTNPPNDTSHPTTISRDDLRRLQEDLKISRFATVQALDRVSELEAHIATLQTLVEDYRRKLGVY